MKHCLRFIFMGFLALANVLYAQPAINSGATTGSLTSTLTLRNLLIEARQLQRDAATGAGIDAAGTVLMRPGQTAATLDITAQAKSLTQSAAAHQQVLVLNGRRATIALRNSVPLRLVQTYVQNGVLVLVAGTVLMEAGTGFDATPRWDGRNSVELELAATQGLGAYHAQTASTATLLVMPLGEWVTVAQSEQDSGGTRSDPGGNARWTAQTGTEVQVRVTVR